MTRKQQIKIKRHIKRQVRRALMTPEERKARKKFLRAQTGCESR